VQDVAVLLNLMCGKDLQRKLKLVYCLHLPGVVLPGEIKVKRIKPVLWIQIRIDLVGLDMDLF
jgi:hypothetical protein